jgi:hypothetical protein
MMTVRQTAGGVTRQAASMALVEDADKSQGARGEAVAFLSAEGEDPTRRSIREIGKILGERRRRRAAVLLSLAAALWWTDWVPAVLVVACLLWAILHKRLEGDPEALLRRWRRVWPPATLVLIPLLLAVTFVFWVSPRPLEAKVLPVALNLFALSMILVGSSWRRVVHLEALWRPGPPSGPCR